MFDKLIADIKQEKIIWASEQYEKGWNNAIDYIVSEYLEAAKQRVNKFKLDES